MSNVLVDIQSATVTSIREFNTYKGYGVDFYIKAQGTECTVYLQVVLFDREARNQFSFFNEGDTVRVAGILKDRPYLKKDGTPGHSLIIENPGVFHKIITSNNTPRSQPAVNSNVPTELMQTDPMTTGYNYSDSSDFDSEEPLY